ncbi:M15 family metallopeptidase [Sediminibacterium soli]|uniref:M15 family metallopeptidase n=1 Tax=Sediminibacterium soli TaxID=2698829 RepID=UPI00137A8307|nr:M15 family metallopeptidase [Sediminibacterium soli]
MNFGSENIGNKVTNAKGGQSNHNFGLAFDIVGITDGKMNYNLDYKTLSEIGRKLGFEWGETGSRLRIIHIFRCCLAKPSKT